MIEFDDLEEVSEARKPSVSSTEGRELKVKSSNADLVLLSAALAVVASAFLPWLVVRIPGKKSTTFKLVEMSGGRILFGLSASLVVLGLALLWRFHSLARFLLVVGASLVGWLAGIGLIALGLIRGLLPSLTVLGIDLSRSLIGPSYGVILAFIGVNLIGIQLIARTASVAHLKSQLSITILIASLLLFGFHQMTWAVVDLNSNAGQIIITGDSLFGALIVFLCIWSSALLSAVGFVKSNQVLIRLAAIALIFASIIKLFQIIILWGGRGLLTLLLPNKVDSAIFVDLRWPVYLTAFASLMFIALGLFVSIAGDKPIGRLNISNFVPSLVGTYSFLVFGSLVVLVIMNGPESTPPKSTLQTSTTISNVPFTTTLPNISPVTPSTLTPSLSITSETPLGAVVNVTLGPPSDECSGGSGVLVGDGTYVLTNEHVITPKKGDPPSCDSIFIGITSSPSQPPSQIFRAKVIDADPLRDLALLQLIDATAQKLPVLKPRYEVLPIDSAVRVIGYPGVGGATITLTRGQIAGYLDDEGGQFYKVDIVLNRGNSGGPMIDEKGNLVGIATAVSGNDVDCTGTTSCESVGGNLGLVRTIGAARDFIERAERNS